VHGNDFAKILGERGDACRLVAIPPRERAAGRMKSVKKAERKKTTCQRSSRKLTSFSPALWSAKKKLPARM